MMASVGELLTAYIAIELLSFCLYVLVSMSRGDSRSPEAGTKYILLGAISSAIFLYGVSLIYSSVGSTFFGAITFAINGPLQLTSIAGFVMLIVGLGFKLSIVPFHVWAPDVYEGAPTPITAHIAVLSKAAATALLLRLLFMVVDPSIGPWQFALAVLAAATMTVGTITALRQSNIKRLLAYSSIAQIGFVLMGAIVITSEAANAVILHVIGYAFTNFAAFMVVIAVENSTGKEGIKDFAGLGSRAPLTAMVMTAALFSLAGLPFFAGFVTKFYLFVATANGGLLWLVIIGVANSLVSLYYYLRVIREMYITEPDQGSVISIPKTTSGILAVLLIGIIFIGVYPAPILDMIEVATRSLG
jgi:NADH-quinone oxidoreductase subunit N